MDRRGFLRGLLIAAPAIVAAPSLMRVSTAAVVPDKTWLWSYQRYSGYDPIVFGSADVVRANNDLLFTLKSRGLIKTTDSGWWFAANGADHG